MYEYAMNNEVKYICASKGVHLGTGSILHTSTAVEGGGAIAAALCSIETSNSLIANSTSTRGNGGAFSLSLKSTLRVDKNSTFVNNTATVGSGGAISCEECNSIELKQNTAFENNIAGLEGGALHLDTPTETVTSTRSLFIGNTAELNGGAISSYRGEFISIDDRYEKNSALSGSGGAVSMTASLLNFDEKTTCQNNSAINGGGGCVLWESEATTVHDKKWKTFQPNISNMQLIQNNNAWYGSSLATPGVSLRVVNFTRMITNELNILQPLFPKVEVLDWYESVVKG
jgi:predicted outer membrane repeat protein